MTTTDDISLIDHQTTYTHLNLNDIIWVYLVTSLQLYGHDATRPKLKPNPSLKNHQFKTFLIERDFIPTIRYHGTT